MRPAGGSNVRENNIAIASKGVCIGNPGPLTLTVAGVRPDGGVVGEEGEKAGLTDSGSNVRVSNNRHRQSESDDAAVHK